MTLGERIKYARQKKGISQTELAQLLGYKSRSSINKIEVDGRDVPRSMIVKFAQVLDVTPSYLMGWEEESSTEQSQRTHEFIQLFSRLSVEQQAMIIDMIKGVLQNQK